MMISLLQQQQQQTVVQFSEAIALSLENDISPEASSEQEGSGAGKAIEDMTEEEQLDYVLRLSTIIQ